MDRDGGKFEDRFVLTILRPGSFEIEGYKLKFSPSLPNAVHAGQPLTGRLVVLVPGNVDEFFSYLVRRAVPLGGKPSTG
ncbi:MAG TPA: hypothetical protein VFC19_32645 [Candidatus Limnocylindrales bacterium]|nr:hypothetical protein [Candidatus Limnocylindrales bacterium]